MCAIMVDVQQGKIRMMLIGQKKREKLLTDKVCFSKKGKTEDVCFSDL